MVEATRPYVTPVSEERYMLYEVALETEPHVSVLLREVVSETGGKETTGVVGQMARIKLDVVFANSPLELTAATI